MGESTQDVSDRKIKRLHLREPFKQPSDIWFRETVCVRTLLEAQSEFPTGAAIPQAAGRRQARQPCPAEGTGSHGAAEALGSGHCPDIFHWHDRC